MRVCVLHNTDWDDELKEQTGADVSAVEESARSVCKGVLEGGYQGELMGIEGLDLDKVFRTFAGEPPDVVFNLCESLRGEARNEIVMPAILELLKIPYTGSDSYTLSLALHKDRSKELLQLRGVPTPECWVIQTVNDFATERRLAYPMFLKLAREDASIGIASDNVAHDWTALKKRATELLLEYEQPVLCEQYIDGREVNVTILTSESSENGFEVMPLHEIDYSSMPAGKPHIISYAAKWDETHPEYGGSMPKPMTDVSESLRTAIHRVSIDAAVAIGMRDYGRVDLRIDSQERPWVIDINPNCDISPGAGFANAAAAGGLSYGQLIQRICDSAYRRRSMN